MLNCLIAILLFSLPPITMKAGDHTIYFHEKNRYVAEAIRKEIGKTQSKVENSIGTKLKEPLNLVITRNESEFMENQPKGYFIPTWVTGTAFPQRRLIVMRSPDYWKVSFKDMPNLLSHELSHIVLYDALGGKRVPKWFDEGLAYNISDEFALLNMRALTQASFTGKMLPLSQLDRYFPASRSGARVAYSSSASMVHFLTRKYGEDGIRNIIKTYAEGEGSFDDAVQSVTGSSLFELEQDWLESVNIWYKWVPAITGAFSLWFLMSLVFLAAYVRKRYQAKAILREWALMEDAGAPQYYMDDDFDYDDYEDVDLDDYDDEYED